MKTIWKYSLKGRRMLHMPSGAVILSVQPQHDDICLWVMVEVSQPGCNRHFACYSTGADLPENPGHYIGTVQLPAGYVTHVFEDTPSENLHSS